jgi:hypothetical protein
MLHQLGRLRHRGDDRRHDIWMRGGVLVDEPLRDYECDVCGCEVGARVGERVDDVCGGEGAGELLFEE